MLTQLAKSSIVIAAEFQHFPNSNTIQPVLRIVSHDVHLSPECLPAPVLRADIPRSAGHGRPIRPSFGRSVSPSLPAVLSAAFLSHAPGNHFVFPEPTTVA